MIGNNEEIIANKERFAEWYRATGRCNNDRFLRHKVDILERWLEERIPGIGIGNLFRFDNAEEFERERLRIIRLPEFDEVNRRDGNGCPLAALGSYKKYLDSFKAGRRDVKFAIVPAKEANKNIHVKPIIHPKMGVKDAEMIKEISEEVKEIAKELVMAFLIKNADQKGATQTEIFNGCGLSFGDYRVANRSRQQFWVIAILQTLRAEKCVERIRVRGPWRASLEGCNRYNGVAKVSEADVRISKLRALAMACVLTAMGLNQNCADGAVGDRQYGIALSSQLCCEDMPFASITQQTYWVIAILCYLEEHKLVSRCKEGTRWRLNVMK